MSSATGMPNGTPNGNSNGIYAGEASSGVATPAAETRPATLTAAEPSAALEEENV